MRVFIFFCLLIELFNTRLLLLSKYMINFYVCVQFLRWRICTLYKICLCVGGGYRVLRLSRQIKFRQWIWGHACKNMPLDPKDLWCQCEE